MLGYYFYEEMLHEFIPNAALRFNKINGLYWLKSIKV